ncbi:uncharacterized protein DUF707 [Sphaerotilus hippei]|uniref:Uncharacterized protein DUF707 n=1 Tax=Sphaerotilus hippei TaxID=744406 RepID=A0A318H508_9BURK|nr:DUF707 domain-containing protein [Sphaerotilus hippei]PXW98823.1 uncharacterized protein DUF707 [Sphaerotilus hippei]
MEQSSRRFLVLGRVGDKSLHKSWIEDQSCDRNWDLQLNAYGKDESRIQDGDLPPVIDRGTKWDSIARHFNAQPELLDRYEYVMLPDDDLLMTARDINRLFDIVVENGLTMAQPALSIESYISWPVLLRSSQFKLRYVNFVESMACCIKSSYLKKLLPMFEQHYTGWGTDMIWTMLMEDPSYQAAVIDDVVMTHTRPLYSGPLYSSYQEGVDPRNELATLTASFENMPGAMLVYGGVLANGRKVGGFEAQLRNGLQLFGMVRKSKLPLNTARMGVAMLIRMFTKAGYRPEQLRPVLGAPITNLLLGRSPAAAQGGAATSAAGIEQRQAA